ncbi:hypothetical protein BZA77DRAFT_302320 [Pyronema omphalodes]|nr:hypothetical protein BZA77DRAFT_302320 [Pyronema omphalodes]
MACDRFAIFLSAFLFIFCSEWGVRCTIILHICFFFLFLLWVVFVGGLYSFDF